MNQAMLWHEDIYEALRTDVQALGGNKKVGSRFWPEIKPPEKAGEKLSRALNTAHAEKLDPEQVIFIITEARKINSFAAMWYTAEQANFEKPEPIEPETEKAKLQREFIEMGKSMQKVAARILALV